MDLYPFYPPLVKVIRPRLQGSMMLRVTTMEMLKLTFWNPARDMQTVLGNIKKFLATKAKLDLNSVRNDKEKYPEGAYIDIEHHLLRLALVSEVTPRVNRKYGPDESGLTFKAPVDVVGFISDNSLKKSNLEGSTPEPSKMVVDEEMDSSESESESESEPDDNKDVSMFPIHVQPPPGVSSAYLTKHAMHVQYPSIPPLEDVNIDSDTTEEENGQVGENPQEVINISDDSDEPKSSGSVLHLPSLVPGLVSQLKSQPGPEHDDGPDTLAAAAALPPLFPGLVAQLGGQTSQSVGTHKNPYLQKLQKLKTTFKKKKTGADKEDAAKKTIAKGTGYSSQGHKGWDMKAWQAAQREKDRQIMMVLERILEELKKFRRMTTVNTRNLPDLLFEAAGSGAGGSGLPSVEDVEDEDVARGGKRKRKHSPDSVPIDPISDLYAVLEGSALVPFLESKLQNSSFLEICRHTAVFKVSSIFSGRRVITPLLQVIIGILREMSEQSSLVSLLGPLPDQHTSLHSLLQGLECQARIVHEKVGQ